MHQFSPIRPRFIAAAVLAAAVGLTALHGPGTAAQAAPEVSVETTDNRVSVHLGGRLFTEYRFGEDIARPYFFPVMTPRGTHLTRQWPVDDSNPDERQDHPHHIGVWFCHGDVNGHDFWHKTEIQVVEVTKAEAAGNTAVIGTCNHWVDDDGTVVVEEARTVTITAHEDGPVTMDWNIELVAPTEGSGVVFGDTKEGTMALRLAQTLTGRDGDGHMFNSEGQENNDAWGKRARWVTVTGPDAEGEKVSIAFFDHPDNFVHPTYWHARTYGLFAANPFGARDFDSNVERAETRIAPGESLTLGYRFVFAEGELDSEAVDALYDDYRGR